MSRLVGLVILVGACGGSKTTTTTTSNTSAARAPAAPTVEMMLAIGAGTAKLADYVDAKRGVVFIDDSDSPGEPDEASTKEEPGLRCGAPLDALVARFQAELANQDTGVALAKSEDRLRCAATMCTIGAAMEYVPAIHFTFESDSSRGLVLRAITLNDEAAVSPEAVDATLVAEANQIQAFGTGTCP